MESGNLTHVGTQYVVMNFMLYSSSPQGRRLFEELLIGNPYDIDIKLDNNSKNRNAEIINSLLKTMGLRLVFNKKLKKKKYLYKRLLFRTIPKPKMDNISLQEESKQPDGKKLLYKRLLFRSIKDDLPRRKINVGDFVEQSSNKEDINE